MALSWEQKTLADLLPGEIDSLVSSAAGVASTVGSILGTIGDIVTDLSIFVVDYIDPIEAATAAFIQSVDDFVADLKSTGVFMLVVPHAPQRALFGRGTDAFIERVQESFYDIGDPNRPQLSSAALIGGVVVMVGDPSFDGLKTPLQKLGNVFGLQEWKDLLRILTAPPPVSATLTQNVFVSHLKQDISVSTVEGFLPNNGTIQIDSEFIEYDSADANENKFKGVLVSAKHLNGALVIPAAMSYQAEPPDWRAAKVVDIFPPFGVLMNSIEKFTKQIASSPKASDVVAEFGQLLSDKADALSNAAIQLDNALTTLKSDFDSTGLHLLKIPEGIGGNQRFIDELANSENKPAFSTDAFTAGVVILGGAGAYSVLETFF